MDVPAPTKRKRSGKAREEAKARAIAAAEEEKDREETRDASDAEEDDSGEEETSVPDLEVIRKRIPQAIKSLHPILKRSKTSETQRIIKKIKFLRKKQEGGTELADLEGMLEVLKKLDLHATIPPLLHLKLRKHPALRPHLPLPPTLFPDPPGAVDMDATTPEGKARNRVLSGKGTGEQVNTVVKWCIGLEGGKLGARKGRGKVAATTGTTTTTTSRRSESKSNTTASKQHVTAHVDDAHEDLAAQDAAADAAGWESGSVNSDEDEGDRYPLMSEDESEDDGSDAERPMKRTRRSTVSPPPPSSNKKAAATGGSSLFLPTLASGFTMGGYDSDPDDDDRRDKKSGKGGLIQSVRKNRRGQAERRKIWEQKYGKGANHVKKREAETERAARDSRFLESQMGGVGMGKPKWGEKRGAGGASAAAAAGVRDEGWQRRTTQSAAAPRPAAAAAAVAAKPPQKAATTVTGTEHPSWKAAKLRKEKEMAGMGGAGALGAVKPKKIVFD